MACDLSETISHPLLRYGEYPHWRDDVDRYAGFPLDGAVVLDVGANIGALTRLFAERAKIVHAFECSPRALRMLRANSPDNVVIHPVALCDHVGSVTFAEGEDIDQCSIAEEGIAVEATTIDALDLDPDFIKIDVEGAEPLVLAGARETIRKHRPLIYFEALDDDAFAASRAEILKAGKYEFVSFGDNHLARPSRP